MNTSALTSWWRVTTPDDRVAYVFAETPRQAIRRVDAEIDPTTCRVIAVHAVDVAAARPGEEVID